jgi:hypothetical protein
MHGPLLRVPGIEEDLGLGGLQLLYGVMDMKQQQLKMHGPLVRLLGVEERLG